MQVELAEAAKEQKSVSPEKLVSAQLGLEQAVFAGGISEISGAFLMLFIILF